MRKFNNYGIEIKALPIKTIPAIKPKVKKERIKHYTKEEILHFNRLGARGVIDDVVRSEMDNREIVFGAKSVNKLLENQPFLQRTTEDWDSFSLDNSKKSAYDVVHALNKRFGGNYFHAKQARHPGTWKVETNPGIGGSRPIVDFTKPDPYRKDIPERESRSSKRITYHKIDSVNYTSKDWLLRQAKGVLKDEELSWRHPKERSKINRLTVAKSVKRKTHVYIPPKQKIVNGERFKLEGFYNSKHAITVKVNKFRQNGYRTRTYHKGGKFYLYSKRR